MKQNRKHLRFTRQHVCIYILIILLYFSATVLSSVPGRNFQADIHETLIIFFDFAMAQSAVYNLDVYQLSNPKASVYYKCVENHFEDLERSWDDMYQSRYG
jgi:hypothetical protein